MKIILNNLQDVRDFVSLITRAKHSGPVIQNIGLVSPELLHDRNCTIQSVHGQEPTSYDPMAAATYGHDLHPEGYDPLAASMDKAVAETSAALRDPEGLPNDVAAATTPVGGYSGSIARTASAPESATIEVDATGRPWDEEIDSAAKTMTAKGVWTRSRRRDLTDERYAERAAEVLAAFRAGRVEDMADEPVATETHALPIDEAVAAVASYPFDQLIEASREAAGELAGDMQPLLVAGRDFIGLYGTAAKDALLEAVVGGQPIPSLREPSDRRRLQACMQNYGSFL